MLVAQLGDDRRAAGGLVADHAPARPARELRQQVGREAVRIGRERLRGDHAHQLPVAGGGILARRDFHQPAVTGARAPGRRHAGDGVQVAQAQSGKVRHVQPADRAGQIPERVRAGVAVGGGVRRPAHAQPVQHDENGPCHAVAPSQE